MFFVKRATTLLKPHYWRYSFRFCKINSANSKVDSDGYIEEKLRSYFNLLPTDNSRIPLFASFENYSASLPVRKLRFKSKLQPNNPNDKESMYKELWKLPHWVDKNEQDYFVKKLETAIVNKNKYEYSEKELDVVKYIAAPPSSGKTCSILPAFLKSTENTDGFTHYLYLAFDNNGRRNFKLQPPFFDKYDTEVAKNLGGLFIKECLKTLLTNPNFRNYSIKRKNLEKTFEEKQSLLSDCQQLSTVDISQEIQEYLVDKFGDKHRILIHVDEHRKMCEIPKEGKGAKEGAAFCKGALETLAKVKDVVVIATYTEHPPIDSTSSSGVCRWPIALPTIDIHYIIKNIIKFPFDIAMNKEQGRMFATFKFRFGVILAKNGYQTIHKYLISSDKNILYHLQQAVKISNIDKALIECSNICKVELPAVTETEYARKLLIGIYDESFPDNFERQTPGNLLVMNGIWTANFWQLLSFKDTKYPIYAHGKDLILDILDSEDYLSATPLEAAYVWVISCEAATGSITFLKKSFTFKCKYLEDGRIFGGDSSILHKNFDKLEKNTLYYVKEGKGEQNHPLCDLFFISDDNELVVIYITGSNREEKIMEKQKKISNWIKNPNMKTLENKHEPYLLQEPLNIKKFKSIYGIIMAPVYDGRSYSIDTVHVICGGGAKNQLRGLQQIFRWLV